MKKTLLLSLSLCLISCCKNTGDTLSIDLLSSATKGTITINELDFLAYKYIEYDLEFEQLRNNTLFSSEIEYDVQDRCKIYNILF